MKEPAGISRVLLHTQTKTGHMETTTADLLGQLLFFLDGGDMHGREYSGLRRADSGFSTGDGGDVGISREGRVSGEGGKSRGSD